MLTRVSLAGHLEIAHKLSLSPNGKYVAIWGDQRVKDGSELAIIAIDAEGGSEKRQFPAVLNSYKLMEFVPDDSALVIQRRQSSAMEIIPLDASKSPSTLAGMYSEAHCVAVSRDGSTVAAASDNEVRIWHAECAVQFSTTMGPEPPQRLELSEGYVLAEGFGGVRIWNRRTKKVQWHEHSLKHAAMRADLGRVFAVQKNEQIVAVSLASGKPLWSYTFGEHNPEKRPVCFAVSENAERFAVTVNDTTCGVYYRSPNRFRLVGDSHDYPIEALTFDRHANLILAKQARWYKPSGDDLPKVRTTGLELGRVLDSTFSSMERIEDAYSVRFSRDGTRCFALSSKFDDDLSETLVSCHLNPPNLVSSIRHEMRTFPGEIVHGLAFVAAPDGARVALGNSLGQVSVYATNSTELITVLTHDSPITSIAFAEGANEIVTGHLSGAISIWSPKDD